MRKESDCRESLTNELLNKRFKSQFDLVRYSIKLAESRIHAGRDNPYPDTENMASEILAEIASGKTLLEDIMNDNDSLDGENSALACEKANQHETKKAPAARKEKSSKKESSGKKKVKSF